MRSHRYPTNRRRRDVLWACALLAVAVFGGGVAYAAITPTYTHQCTLTPKSNGGQVLDCDPIEPSTSPSATPSPSGSPTAAPTTPAPTTPAPTTNPPTTTTAPPTSPPAVLRDCLHQLAACGFPNAANTGPSGTLTTWTGSRSFTVAGQQISDKVINGCVEVRAPDVTFRNVQFNANGCFWGIRQFSTNLQIYDSAITCGGFTGTAFGSSSMSVVRVEITGCENGLDGGSAMLLQDSWIHDMQTCCGAHTDGFQLGRGSADITIRHNTIDMGPGPGSTGAVMIWNEGDPQARRISVDANLLAWGTYSIYCGRFGVVDNIRIINNRFGPAEYGYANECNDGETWFGNVRDVDNAPLVAS